MEKQKELIVQKLKDSGCRITKQRLMILDIIVRPRACFLARSFSGSEKRRVRKPKNHLLCKWIRMLQLTEKPPML